MGDRVDAKPDALVGRGFRQSLRSPALLVTSEGKETPVVLTDKSDDGFRIRTFESLEAGAPVLLRVPNGRIFPAQIRWALGSGAGGMLLRR
jgi:hypothetical protein